MDKKELSEEVINKIIEEYTINKTGVQAIGRIVGFANTTVTRILTERGLYKCRNGNIAKIEDIGKYEYHFRCKLTNKIFKHIEFTPLIDVHIQELYPDIKIPNSDKKRRILSSTGKFWFEDYFILDKKLEIVEVECKICGWKGKNVITDSKALVLHLHFTHQMKPEQYINQYPETKDYFKRAKIRIARQETFTEENVNYVECKICNKKFKSISVTHLNQHNITVSEYKEKYLNVQINSQQTKEKLKEGYDKHLRFYEPTKIGKAQYEIYSILKPYFQNIKLNNRSTLPDGMEIDILINDINFGIEYNGNFFHTEVGNNRDRNHHLKKLTACNENGFKLIQICEDEWRLKKNIVISKIKHLCNINDELIKIHARKTIIKEITKIQKELFLDQNHIQGDDKSNYFLGAFYNDDLISVMTFDNNRFMNVTNNLENEWVLSRFCVKNNLLITGIANKILKYFINIKNPTKIISFADRRWTVNEKNNLYTKLGFNLDKILPPNYTYYNNKISRYKRFSKYGFGKNKLKEKFPQIYSDDKSENDIMLEAGYDRIWDCGLLRYTLNFLK